MVPVEIEKAIIEDDLSSFEEMVSMILSSKEDPDSIISQSLKLSVMYGSFKILDFLKYVWYNMPVYKDFDFSYHEILFSLRKKSYNLDVFFKKVPYYSSTINLFNVLNSYFYDTYFPVEDKVRVLKFLVNFNFLGPEYDYIYTYNRMRKI